MKGEGTKRKYLVKWKDHDEESWVKLADLKGAQELIDAFHAGRRVKRAKGNPDDDSGAALMVLTQRFWIFSLTGHMCSVQATIAATVKTMTR